jgi:hypothetical protein
MPFHNPLQHRYTDSCDHVLIRSWRLFKAKHLLRTIIETKQ